MAKKENQPETEEEVKTTAEPKAEQKKEAPKGKTVKATFKESLWTDLGVFYQGETYEIPESRFTQWEKALVCTKAEK